MAKTSSGRDKEITREIHRFFWRANWQDKAGWSLVTLLESLQECGIYAELWAHQNGGYVGLPTTTEEEL